MNKVDMEISPLLKDQRSVALELINPIGGQHCIHLVLLMYHCSDPDGIVKLSLNSKHICPMCPALHNCYVTLTLLC